MAELELSDVELDRLADLVAARMGRRADPSPWLSAREAAAYLACPLSRIRRLTMTGDLPVHRDGSRVLYRRDELDAYVAAGGAVSP
jgi:excisionase family DNA binding protein